MNYYLMREGATCYIWALRFNPQVLPYRRSNQYLMGKWAEKKQKATCLRKKAAFQRDECRELLQVTNAYMNISLLAFYVYIYHMLWFVSMTPLSHCILKQLLVNHINCKDITDYTQSYHSRKATRQPTHFYNSKGKSKSEWQTKSQQLGTAFRQCILESSQLWKNCTIATAIYWDQITIHWDQITIHWDQISIHWDQITIHGDRQKQAF